MKAVVLAFAAAVSLSSCKKSEPPVNPIVIKEEIYGKMPDGKDVKIFTLENGSGVRVKVMEYGATLVSVEVPDRDGKVADVATGYDTLEGWLEGRSYFGATVGRYGNRIAEGKFTLDGKEYTLATNNRPGGIPCHLHGGVRGFDKALWKGRVAGRAVEFTYLSKDGEEGYPGNLEVKVVYSLDEENKLTWAATATTDAATVVNLVQHVYWNLTGNAEKSVMGHELVIDADHFLVVDAGLIPTGERAPVAGTPMDFTKPAAVGSRIDEDFPELKGKGGYDHAYVLRPGDGVRKAAVLYDPESGRKMELSTDAPAVQLYTANFGGNPGKGGASYRGRAALCLETEAFPDAPNQPDFPSTVLRPGEIYRHTMECKFSAE